MKTLVLGIGNTLQRDEGFGPRFIEYFSGRISEGAAHIPPDTDLLDGATRGLDLMEYFESCERVIVIDAIDVDEEPGAVFMFDPRKVKLQEKPLTSLHDTSLTDILGVLKFIECKSAQVTIIAVQIKVVNVGMELSPELKQVFPKVESLVLNTLTGK